MKIAKVELYHVQIPLEKTFYPTWIPGYPQTHNSFTLIRLETKCGIEGWSAGAAMGREREGLGELIGGYLIGLDPEDIPSANQRLKEASYLGWRNYWIEPAFWDIVGKSKANPFMSCWAARRDPSKPISPPERCATRRSAPNNSSKWPSADSKPPSCASKT
jgi:L-alanine-DL-glutamate epimerase-like enolase superfamily enzyme